ncbi:MAG: riboflavin synthase [Bacteroidetes bacterium]|nr:MAG: riboflavin synthase [Bacteroidota bacterium]
MFTGIIETTGKVLAMETAGTNTTFTIEATFGEEPIKVDQSIAHDGACLTVTHVGPQAEGRPVQYTVTAISETLNRTQLGSWVPGHRVNLERCLKAGGRLDGHFVQGHVDATGEVVEVHTLDGSWTYRVRFPESYSPLLVPKGSVCVNGVSLTVVEAGQDSFTVAIIPYTFEHTNFQELKVGSQVNLEFDILGKYMQRIMAAQTAATS